MNQELIKQLKTLRTYKEKGCLDLSYKLLIDYIDDLEEENNKLNHYKKLYQSVKKQKDNVIEFIKKLDKECEKDGCSFVNLIEVLKILEILEVCDVDD